jgi:PilZ domain
MQSRGRRRSERVHIEFPVEVRGTDAQGHPFSERGRTSLISRHGAVIVLGRDLATAHGLIIRCPGNKGDAAIRIVGLLGGQGNELVYGVAFSGPEVNPWGVRFPSQEASDETLARTLLQCAQCQSREVVHLNEIEIQVFEANKSVQRPCQSCSATTSWTQGSNQALGDLPAQLNGQPLQPNASATQPAPDGRHKRKHARIRTKVLAGVRQSGFPEEIVECEDLSGGGICFRSATRYMEGSPIELAVPYSKGSGNIFVPARIVFSQKFQELFRHGAAYVRSNEKQKNLSYEGSPITTTKSI